MTGGRLFLHRGGAGRAEPRVWKPSISAGPATKLLRRHRAWRSAGRARPRRRWVYHHGVAVDVGTRGLKTSARNHRDAARALDPSSASALLLFYAVECGLKEALMTRQAISDTSALPEDLRTHDLRRLAKELRLPPTAQIAEAFRRSGSGTMTRIITKDLHQAWRYGCQLHPDDEATAIAGLAELFGWYANEKGW